MSTKIATINLINKSSTFPDLSFDPLIPLDSKVRGLQRKFSPQNQIIILKGSPGSGKTAHLIEFVRANSQSSFSYFITDNYWCRRQTSFLSSLCQQMSAAVGTKSHQNTLSVDTPNLDSEGLRIIFENLVEKVIEMAKQTDSVYYFVIDGLERAFEGNPGERISDLLPLQTNPKHLYLLGSISHSAQNLLDFNYLSEEPTTFSSLETENYLEKAGITVSPELLEKVQATSGGVPGYLSVLRKLHLDKIQQIAQAIDKPLAVEDLLKIQWNAVATKSLDHEKLILVP